MSTYRDTTIMTVIIIAAFYIPDWVVEIQVAVKSRLEGKGDFQLHTVTKPEENKTNHLKKTGYLGTRAACASRTKSERSPHCTCVEQFPGYPFLCFPLPPTSRIQGDRRGVCVSVAMVIYSAHGLLTETTANFVFGDLYSCCKVSPCWVWLTHTYNANTWQEGLTFEGNLARLIL